MMRDLMESEVMVVNGGLTDFQAFMGFGVGGLAIGSAYGFYISSSPVTGAVSAVVEPVVAGFGLMTGGALGLGIGLALGVTFIIGRWCLEEQ